MKPQILPVNATWLAKSALLTVVGLLLGAPFPGSAGTPIILLTDSFNGAGTPNTSDLNYNLAGRQIGALGLVRYTGAGNAQVGNTGEPNDGGRVLLCAGAGTAALNYNFNQSRSAGGLKLSFDLDPNTQVGGNADDWGAVNLGASFANRGQWVNTGAPHFGILFRANGGFQAFDGGSAIASGNWAPAGSYGRSLHHFDIVMTDATDGNPFDGTGETTIEVYAGGSDTPFYTFTKTGGGYADNYISFQGLAVQDFDNLIITAINPPAPLSNTWATVGWIGDLDSGIDPSLTYTHAYNFGSANNVTINGVTFTGAGGGNPSVGGQFAVAGIGNVFGDDGGNNISGASSDLGRSFIYGGNPGTLTLSGLTPGKQYVLTLYSKAWEAPGNRIVTFSATSSLGGDSREIDQDSYGSRNGIRITYAYTADANGTLTVTMTPAVGANTFHCYGFSNHEGVRAANWTASRWISDATAGLDPLYTYTHAYNFGASAGNVNVNGVVFTGKTSVNPSETGKFSTANYTGQAGRTPAGISGNSATLASQFIYGGNPEVLNLQGLTPGTEYILSLFAYGWDAVGRVVNVVANGDAQTVDQDAFSTDQGVVINYRYTADGSGALAVNILPMPGGAGTFHLSGFANREANLQLVEPSITLQPQGIALARGLDWTFTAAANGYPAPEYQWFKDGVALPNETNASLTLASVTNELTGSYQLVASNQVGAATSVVAVLKVGLPMTNPSFEVDSFPNAVGYISQNFPITGWTHSLADRLGLNPIGNGQFWFTDNGTIPHGTQAAFLQDGSLSTTVNGLVVGQDYYVEYYENARNCCGGVAALTLTVSDGVNPSLTIVPEHAVPSVLGANPYRRVTSYGFIATATSLTFTFTKTSAVAGDSTALIDNICVLPLPPGTPPVILIQPQSTYALPLGSATLGVVASGSSPLHYQWRKNGADLAGANSPQLILNHVTLNDDADYTLVVTNSAGATTSAVAHLTVLAPLDNLFNTGVDATGAPLAPGAVDPHFTLLLNPDSASTDALVQSVIPGAWMANSASSQWIGPRADTGGAAGGDYTYRFTIDLTGRNPAEVYLQGNWTSDNAGPNIAVNGVDTGNVNGGGFGGWYPFVLASTNANFVAGVNTIDFKVNNASAGFTGLRVEFVLSHARLADGSPPVIIQQPQGGLVSLGDNVELVGNASGSPPMRFQWRKNGEPLPGENGPVLALPNFSPANSGDYTLVVTNDFGAVTSAVASVVQVYLPITTLFNSGVDENHAVAAGGSTDLHYTLSGSADPLYPGPAAVVLYNNVWPVGGGTYLGNGPASAWISPALNGTNLAGGVYVYRTTFQITEELDWTAAWIHGHWASDNDVVDVRLNGISLGISNTAGFTTLSPFAIASGFEYGSNLLEFTVANGDGSPHAFRVEMKGGAPTNPPFAPVISAQPQSQLVQHGGDASFSVSTTNGHPTWYQWYFEGIDLPGENRSSLHLAAVNQFDQQGGYWVVMSNRYGTVTSEVATLTINMPPEASDTNLNATTNQPALLSVAKVLAQCRDADGDALTVQSVSNSTNGALVSVDGANLVYTPVPGFVGLDQFRVEVTDGRAGTAVITVTVFVYPGNIAGLNILAPQPLPGGVQFLVAGIPGRSYNIERALAVAGPWTNLASVLVPPNGLVPFLDTNSPPAQAFYRTLAP